jgi:hypothetical protein
MQAEGYVDEQLSHLAESAGLSLVPRLLSALTLIQRSASFEGDGDLAAAHLVLHDVLRDLAELHERTAATFDSFELERRPDLRVLLGGD